MCHRREPLYANDVIDEHPLEFIKNYYTKYNETMTLLWAIEITEEQYDGYKDHVG